MHRNLTIIGIDPGTTTGIAILSIEGKVLFVGSQKHLGLNELIRIIITYGNPILIGTDKAKTPSLVDQVGAKTGSRVIFPPEDLKVLEKRWLIRMFNAQNSHANDALAAALFAHQKIKPTIEKVLSFIAANNKQHIKDQLLGHVIRHGLSIHEALSILEEKQTMPARIVKKVVEEKKLSEEDFLSLFKKCRQLAEEAALLRRHNHKLMTENKRLEKMPRVVPPQPNSLRKTLDLKDKSISFLGNELKKRQEQIRFLRAKNDEFHSMLSRWKDIVVITKVRSLGIEECRRLGQTIQEGDILFVENPSIISMQVVESLKGIVTTLAVHSRPSRSLQGNFSIIDISQTPYKSYGAFIILKKKDFEQLSKKQDFSDIISDYQKKRDYMMSS